MTRYTLYGLTIDSALDITGLPRSESPVDVSITFGDATVSQPESDRPVVTADSGTIRLRYPAIGTFEIHQGSRIVIDPVTGAPGSYIRLVLMGPVLGLLLFQREFLVLHGSTVARDGNGFVFLGPKGAGKSTAAAAFAHDGYTVVCDDMTVVDTGDTPFRVRPGRPLVKLEDDSFGYEEVPTDESRTITKQYYRVPGQTMGNQTSIDAVFLLDRGDELRIESLEPGETVWGLLEHLYLRQFADSLALKQCFDQVTALADDVPVRRLIRPDDLEMLPTLIQRVEDVTS